MRSDIYIYIKEARTIIGCCTVLVSKYVRVATISKRHINICLRVSSACNDKLKKKNGVDDRTTMKSDATLAFSYIILSIHPLDRE